ncbi:MAG: twin-arginine translocation signal domain-containing protein, partial [Planctomycetes bacterium]|nr:twin-arginine translocation signal domain-containing protein [Planctomycetota bacterium]
MHPNSFAPSRRDLLCQTGFGVGAMGLASLLSQDSVAAPSKPG